MTWIPLTRPDKGKVWLNSKADFWRIIDVGGKTEISYGDAQQTVLETPEQIIAMLEKPE